MGRSARRLKRKTQRRKMTRPEVAKALGTDQVPQNVDELPALALKMAGFREAADYQQFVSEILQHATQCADQFPEEHEDYEYFQGARDELQEVYFDARRQVHDRALEVIDEMNPMREESRIVVPQVLPNGDIRG